MPRDYDQDRALYAAIGRRIRSHRRMQRLAAWVIAHESGMNANHLRRVETGHRPISAAALYRIAVALDVPVTKLLPDARDLGFSRSPRMLTRGAA